ncbi:GerAB/ArcD/ProY family transporter [Rubeoparvulum massiliense]|uniref:GerAB/ArcD/ProY family transporter n=1 Tax=Rubeoparvulum massiliense TaxID=1631346 RepID=UPI00065E0042|nr:endospore germination permease [Rubeoparvulum massiliense]
MEKTSINIRQLTMLIFMFTVGSSILLTPAYITTVAKQDAWLAGIITLGAGLLAVYLFMQLAIGFPNQTIVQFTRKLMGKYIGTFFSFLYLFYLYILSGLILENMGFFMVSQIIPETPIIAIYTLFLFILLLALRYGVESVARTTELFFPSYCSVLIILILFVLPEVDLENIKPVVAEGVKPIIHGSLLFFSFPFCEISAFLIFTPQVHDQKKLAYAFLYGTFFGGLVLTILIFLSIAVLGPDITARSAYPTYLLAQKVNIGNFLTRVEALIAIIWLIGLFIKLFITLHAVVIGLKQLLSLKSQKTLTFPLSFLLISFTLLMIPSQMYIQSVNLHYFWLFEITLGFFYPLVLWILFQFRKRSSKQGGG